MGQKVNPHGLRVGVIKDWDSKWYAEDNFADNLVEDYNIRKFLKNKLRLSSTQLNRVLLSVRVVLKSKHLRSRLKSLHLLRD